MSPRDSSFRPSFPGRVAEPKIQGIEYDDWIPVCAGMTVWTTAMSKLFVVGVLAALTGCSLSPEYKTPEFDVTTPYKEAAALPEAERGLWKEAQPSEHVARGEWWHVFQDETLNALEAQALEANAQLQAAAARLARARAIVGIARADQLPQISGGFGPARQRPSAAALGLPDGTDMSPTTVWRAPVFASYEVDLFGRIGDGVQAARSDAESAEASYRSFLLALQADVARLYFDLRATDAELTLLRDTLGLREQNADLTAERYEAGVTSELDVARARTELATTRSEAIALERRRGELEHALAVLVGKVPASFDLPIKGTNGEAGDGGLLAGAVPRIPAGLPSHLLERRPDITAAQRSLNAANARIGVARAAFFPVLNLTATGGFESNDLSDLFQWSSRTWLLGPLAGTILSTPIFTGGRNTANLDHAWAAYDESVALYRDTVLNAFADVEDALVGLRVLSSQAVANAEAIASARRATEIAQARYGAGAANYLEVIDAQRSHLAIERLTVQIEGARRTATVALIRALGGGWEAPASVAVRE